MNNIFNRSRLFCSRRPIYIVIVYIYNRTSPITPYPFVVDCFALRDLRIIPLMPMRESHSHPKFHVFHSGNDGTTLNAIELALCSVPQHYSTFNNNLCEDETGLPCRTDTIYPDEATLWWLPDRFQWFGWPQGVELVSPFCASLPPTSAS